MSAPSRRPKTADITHIALFAVLLAVCGWISVPIPPIPFTLQTFGVFAAMLFLGGRRSLYAVAVYLLLGAVGLPVFSGFRGGIGILLEATGGYLLGFLLCPLAYGLATARSNRASARLSGCLLGLLACYAFGMLWYLLLYGGGVTGLLPVLSACVLPFLLPDLIKLGLAFLLHRRLNRYLK